jgi:hypothetical protein
MSHTRTHRHTDTHTHTHTHSETHTHTHLRSWQLWRLAQHGCGATKRERKIGELDSISGDQGCQLFPTYITKPEFVNLSFYVRYTVSFTDLDQEREILSRFSLPKSMKHSVGHYPGLILV